MSAIGLPVNILAHFVPRPPTTYVRPLRELRRSRIGAMAHYTSLFDSEPAPPPPEIPEPPAERRKRAREERLAQHETLIAEQRSLYKPTENARATSDPYKSLFVGRLAYETTEKTLRRVFEEWGPVKGVTIVSDKEGKSRGYAFIEFESERDLRDAYKHADGIKIDGRHVLVDVERGRTVSGWFPRRLAGGKGPGRDAKSGRQTKRKAQQSYARDSRQRRSPPRGKGGYPPNKYPRESRTSSRRSSFNY